MQQQYPINARLLAIIAGVLYIIGTVSGVFSLTFITPIREGEELFASIAANETQIVSAAMAVLVMGLALAFVPVVLFPILKKRHEILTVGYVVFRSGLETMIYLLMVICWLLLIPLNQAYAQASTPDSNWQLLADLLLNTERLHVMLAVVFCLSAFMFYTVLFQSRLVPRWLSGWGLIGAVLYIIAGILPLFGILESQSSTQVTMFMPLALQEMVLALWFIVRGFNRDALLTGA